MKERKNNGRGSAPANAVNLHGVLRAEIIGRNINLKKILGRLREYLQYRKLKHLLDAYPLQTEKFEERAMELDMESWEVPEGCSGEESSNASMDSGVAAVLNRSYGNSKEQTKNQEESCKIEIEVEEVEDEESEAFVPSIKIRRIDDILLISTLVRKEMALTSSLFAILEEEKLDILSENQYRTETIVGHTIQVKVQPEYKVDELEKKLREWAASKHT